MSLLSSIVVKARKYTTILAGLAFMFATTSIALAATSDEQNVPFPALVDTTLQNKLDQLIVNNSLEGEVSRNRLSVTLVDITDIEKPRLAHINGKNTFYAASLPKLAIMLAVFEEIHQGKLELTEELENSLKLMIQVSSNKEATRLYELVGPARIAEILQSDRYQLYDADTGGGLWVGKPYGKQPAWKRDPLKLSLIHI